MKATSLRFTRADQAAFAKLSGDFNPIHIDAAAARRVAVGEPIAHGIHVLLRTLNDCFASISAPMQIEARFERPIVVDDVVRVERTSAASAVLTLDGSSTLATIDVRRKAAADAAKAPPRDPVASRRTPAQARVLTLDQIEGGSGLLELRSTAALERRFPRAARAAGPRAVAALAAISRLVGMECPGRDSLLSGLSVTIDGRRTGEDLRWQVTRVDPRFGLVRMDIEGGGIHGTVDAFVRPAPRENPAFATVSHEVRPSEFSGQRALIVGGSRGLGAATALIVAAGDGRSLVTFATGKTDAARLRRDAVEAGKRIDTLQFDLIGDSPGVIASACKRFRPTHLYYFATPRIFARRHDQYDGNRFQRFADFYVSGFAAVCAAAKAAVPSLRVLFPSTTALDGEPVRDLAEYAAAKAAGEVLCRSLTESLSGMDIVVRRLPRVATDQTASILPFAAADPVAVMLPIVRDMHRNLDPS